MTKKGNYTVLRRVRVPQLKMQEGEEYAVKFTAPYHTEASRNADQPGNVTIGFVTDLDTGEQNTVVLGAVLCSLLSEEPGGYVDKCYLITVGEKGDKGWRDYYLDEIADPAGDDESNESAA